MDAITVNVNVASTEDAVNFLQQMYSGTGAPIQINLTVDAPLQVITPQGKR